jgi:hypothetical protein
MAIRALIIAIENYPRLEEVLAGTLTGTLQNAVAFRKWLIDVKMVDPKDILFCSEPRTGESTAGAAKQEIREAVMTIRDDGATDTEELYFYFSGHGFAQMGLDKRASAISLLPSDYVNPKKTGDLPIKHDEIVNLFQHDMGPGVHFHFVDACRHERKEAQFPAGSLGIPYREEKEQNNISHLLYSTSNGDAARVDSGFGEALVDGLHGTARAKTWLASPGLSKLVVRFESLVDFIRSRVTKQAPDPDPGDVGKDLIYEFRPPIEKKNCEIIVENAGPGLIFSLRLADANQQEIGAVTFEGSRYSLQRLPNDYFIELTTAAARVEPLGWVAVDLYEDATKRFRIVSDGGAEPKPSPTMPPTGQARLDLNLPAGASGVLTHLATGRAFDLISENSLTLPTGKYHLEVKDADKWTIRRKTLDIAPEAKETVDLTAAPTALHQEILNAVPLGQHQRGTADFSESLGGPLQDQDPALWLAIIGASHIIKEQYDFAKLEHLPLADFSDVSPGNSALYVLVGLDEQPDFLKVAISDSEQVNPDRWDKITKVEGFEHLSQHMNAVSPGSAFLSVAFGETSVITFSTAFLPNRATFVTITQDRQGSLQVQQMMLPLGHLLKEFPEEVRYRVFTENPESPGSRPLRNIKFIVQAQRAFRKRLALDSGGEGHRPEELNYLLYGKWLDPVMAALASYELIRRGSKENLDEVVYNLLTYFPGFPDTIAIARMVTGEAPPRIGWPLFLDGLSAFKNYQEILPLPASKLDYRGMWTMWRGAIRVPTRDESAVFSPLAR